MKNPRWRKIIKVIQPHAKQLMYTYFHHEQALATCGVSVLTLTKEIALLDTLQGYADIVERTAKIEQYSLNKDWFQELMNFQS